MGDQDPSAAHSPAAANSVSEALQAVNLDSEKDSTSSNGNNVASSTSIEAASASGSSEQSLVKIYIGSLPTDIDEEGLKNLLSEKNLPSAETVLVKRGYAFLEFDEQSKADESISILDGLEFNGFNLKAEMSVGADKKG